MRAWLETNEIAAFTNQGDWPSPETAALWARFRTDALAGGAQKWSVETFKRRLDTTPAPSAPAKGLYRVLAEADAKGRTWLVTPDYRYVSPFVKPISEPKLGLLSGWLPGESKVVEALRIGPGKARWPLARES